MADALTLQLYPRSDALSLQGLIEAVANVQRVIRHVDYALTRNKKGTVWIVESLRSSTPTITIRPMLDHSGVVDAFADGIRVLTAEEAPQAPPDGWTEDALDDLRKMKRLFTRQNYMRRMDVAIDGATVATVRDDIQYQVDRVLRGGYSLLGSLEGTLEAVNLHRRAIFTIWERVTGKPVPVSFPLEMKENVRQCLDRRVLAAGQINYYRNGMPQSITKLRALQDMTPTSEGPVAGFGSIPDLTGGVDAVEYLRRMRE